LQHSDEVKLAKYQLDGGDILTAVALLVEVDTGVQRLRFELQWDNPQGKEDYLDGSCFLYEHANFVKVVDFQHRHSGIEARNDRGEYAATHTGDKRLDKGWSHGIEVLTSAIPAHVTHLFFSLSAYSSPTIGAFPNPGVEIFEPMVDGAVRPLGGYGIERAGDQQAVVMCAMYRRPLGWRVAEVEQFCAGNAKEYAGILATCQGIVTNGLL
jgi:stress response protein SCP2